MRPPPAGPAMPLDYNQIAETYDHHRRGGGPYFEVLVNRLRSAPGPRTLELGAGTGNNTAAVHDACPLQIVALERARGMIAHARAKGVPGAWVQGDATALPFRRDSFHAVLASYLLHHIASLDTLFTDCVRVLVQGGCAVFVTVPESFIANHPMNRYFPSFAQVDLARFQPIAEVEAALRRAGFSEVASQNTVAEPRPVDTGYLEKIRNQFISTYNLLPAAEFDAGVRRLAADVADGTAQQLTIAREATVVWGYR